MITVSFIIQLISASFIGCAKDSRGEVDKLQLSVTNMFTSVSTSLSINSWVAHRIYWFFSENILKRKCKHQHDFRVSDHGSCGEVGALRLPVTSLHAEYRSPPEEAEAPFLQAAIRVFILLVGIRKTTSTKTGEPLYMKNHHCGRVTLRQRSPPSSAQGPGARNAHSHCFGDLTPDPVFLHKQLKRQLSQLQYQLFIVNFAFLSKLRIPVLYFLQQL